MAGAVRPKGYADEFLNTLYDDACIKTWAKVFLGAQAPTVCPQCKPGRCDGTTQDCTQESYYANPANGPRPSASGGTAQNPAPATDPYEIRVTAYPGFRSYPATRYDDEHSVPTERLPVPPPLRCECGTGDHTRSGAHSHWCPCWVSA